MSDNKTWPIEMTEHDKADLIKIQTAEIKRLRAELYTAAAENERLTRERDTWRNIAESNEPATRLREAEIMRLRAALKLISEEEMRYEGDVVDISRKALGEQAKG